MEGQRFMYVKQELLNNIRQNQVKVLINPNFVNSAIVRPHINKQFLRNQSIHINPNVMKQRSDSHRTVVLVDDGKVVANKEAKKQALVVSTPTKIVRSPNTQTGLHSKRRTSIHSKYKIIRSTASTKTQRPNHSNRAKNKFAIDNRSPATKLKHFSFNKNRLKVPNVYSKNNVSGNGLVYKNSHVHNNMKVKRKPTVGSALKVQILTIRGQKYKLDSGHHTLTLMNNQMEKPKPSFKTIYVGRMAFKQKEPNIYVKTNTHKKFALLSQAKQRSINTLTNKLRKSNIPCPLYHKFGKCKGKDSGKCFRLHNPDQISLCPRFLQGACTNSKCLLSHKVSAEKMPTCKFFLEGLCSKDDCPYLHVKINSKAEICKDFLEGFCRKAAECEKRHEYLCPNYERSGQCSKSNCHYPHGPAGKVKHKVVKKKVERSNTTTPTPDCASDANVRYYDDSKLDKDLVGENSVQVESMSSYIPVRPRLGTLPAFIPFCDMSQSSVK